MLSRLSMIEDDAKLALATSRFLEKNGFDVDVLSKGNLLRAHLKQHNYDLILCDVMLPGSSGFELAKIIREQFEGPLLFISALADTKNELKGFEVGGDDYIAKPVDPAVLLARIRSKIRNNLRNKAAIQTPHIIHVGTMELDKSRRVMTVKGEKIHLTTYEFDVLWFLANQNGVQVSREALFAATVGREYDGLNRTVDGRISRLRKKLDALDSLSHCIVTQWGKGYMFTQK